MTVKEIIGMWLFCGKSKKSTLAAYSTKLDLHIYPAFGGENFGELSKARINDFIGEKLAEGLSPRYLSDIVTLLKNAGKYAEKELGYDNPFKNVPLPKFSQKELVVMPRREQETLKTYLRDNPGRYSAGILLCLFTGMRIGELCALKWEDVDLSGGTIKISRTAQRIKCLDGENATEIVITLPKSNKTRDVPLADCLIGVLANFASPPECYFLSGTEKLVEPRMMQYHFTQILKKANVPHINFHALRHTFATNCVAAGVDVKTLSDILGHSSVEFTLNRYVHPTMDNKRDAVNKLKF